MAGNLFRYDGGGAFRTLFAWEYRAYARHLRRLTCEDRQARFLGVVSEAFIDDHAQKVLAAPRSKVIGWFCNGTLRGAAEVQWNHDRAGEAAFSVEASYRSHHIGSGLARRVLRMASNRSLRHVSIVTQLRNLPMRRIGSGLGAKFHYEDGLAEGMLIPQKRSPFSILVEGAENQLSIGKIFQRMAWQWLTVAGPDRPLPKEPA